MNSKISYIANEEGGPAVGVEITLPDDGGQIWTGEASKHLLKESAAAGFDPSSSGVYLVAAPFGEDAQVVAQVSTPQQAIDLALALALRAEMAVDPSSYAPLTESQIGHYDEWLGREITADDVKAHEAPDHISDGGKMVTGWIVSNANGDRWRTWEHGFTVWTPDRDKATRYARREDAETVHAEDDDAWRVTPYSTQPLSNTQELGGADLIAELRKMPRCHCAGDDWPSLYDRAADAIEAAAAPVVGEPDADDLASMDDFVKHHGGWPYTDAWSRLRQALAQIKGGA